MMDYDIRHGRTYMYFTRAPLYPFGFGLSYTTFAYSNLRLNAPSMRADDAIVVTVDVKNTGARAGDEVVQVYVGYPSSKVARAAKALTGFRRVSLAPGETKTVSLPLRAEQLAWWDEARRAFAVESGPVRVMVGASSADIRLETTFRVEPGASRK